MGDVGLAEKGKGGNDWGRHQDVWGQFAGNRETLQDLEDLGSPAMPSMADVV
jgi:hypothetical protein